MGADQEIEGLLDGVDIIRKGEGSFRHGRWTHKILPWVAAPSIFLLGMAAGWLLQISQCRPYHDTTMSPAQALPAKSFYKYTNISLGPGDYSDVFRLPPSKEVDDAWNSLYTNSILLLTESEIRQMGKNPAEHVHLPENSDFGYGDRRWLAKFDHIHMIHCLNMVRKFVHSEYYFPHGKPKHLGLIHVDHCIRSLLEGLMCHVDYGMYTYQWLEGEPSPEPDFQVNRQCRDYSALLDVARQNRVDYDRRVQYVPRPADAIVFPQDAAVEKATLDFEASHPDELTRHEQMEIFRERYESGVQEGRRTGRVPLVEPEYQFP